MLSITSHTFASVDENIFKTVDFVKTQFQSAAMQDVAKSMRKWSLNLAEEGMQHDVYE